MIHDSAQLVFSSFDPAVKLFARVAHMLEIHEIDVVLVAMVVGYLPVTIRSVPVL